MSVRGLGVLGVGFAGVALLTGCHASASIGGNSISKSDIESKAASTLAAQTGQPTPTVVCPNDLNAKVGATITCQLTPQGSTDKDPVTVTVTSVNDDGTYHLSFSVGSPSDSSS